MPEWLRRAWTWVARREWAVTVLVVLAWFFLLEVLRLAWNAVGP
jgi:hypothetical protein